MAADFLGKTFRGIRTGSIFAVDGAISVVIRSVWTEVLFGLRACGIIPAIGIIAIDGTVAVIIKGVAAIFGNGVFAA